MCASASASSLTNMLFNPLPNLQKDKKDSTPAESRYVASTSAAATTDADKMASEAKQKQLSANRRNRRSTILANLANVSSSSGKTLLGS